jgi:hypothetical protein
LLQAHKPELLGFYGFPDHYTERFQALIDAAEAEFDRRWPGSKGPRLAELLRLARAHGRLTPGVHARFEQIIWDAERAAAAPELTEPPPFEDTARAHVERILTDL